MILSRSGVFGILSLVFCAAGFAATTTVSNSLYAAIVATGAIAVPGTVALTQSGAEFNAFTGAVSVQYRVRTTSTGGGSVTLNVTQDFQTGGPSVASGDLTYTCGSATLGTACGNTTASTTSATTVLTLPTSACTGGGSPCSSVDPNTVNLTFTLADRPAVKTGSYSASIQFTISAT